MPLEGWTTTEEAVEIRCGLRLEAPGGAGGALRGRRGRSTSSTRTRRSTRVRCLGDAGIPATSRRRCAASTTTRARSSRSSPGARRRTHPRRRPVHTWSSGRRPRDRIRDRRGLSRSRAPAGSGGFFSSCRRVPKIPRPGVADSCARSCRAAEVTSRRGFKKGMAGPTRSSRPLRGPEREKIRRSAGNAAGGWNRDDQEPRGGEQETALPERRVVAPAGA